MKQSSPHRRILAALRADELSTALKYFPPANHESGRRRTVLEIGAGTGQQAKEIERLGYRVLAIDLESSDYKPDRLHPVVEYDGYNIPMADATADIIFSSNVLEHVRNIDDLLNEIRRVMKPEGTAIHVLPSSICRFWSFFSHYIWLMRRISARFIRTKKTERKTVYKDDMPRMPNSSQQWFSTLFPMRHGERGLTVTEIYFYSRHWWRQTFRRNYFRVVRVEKNHLFYTMANSFADLLTINVRRRLSRLLGSACNIYVLKRELEARKDSGSPNQF